MPPEEVPDLAALFFAPESPGRKAIRKKRKAEAAAAAAATAISDAADIAEGTPVDSDTGSIRQASGEISESRPLKKQRAADDEPEEGGVKDGMELDEY